MPVTTRKARATFGISLIILLANCGEDPVAPRGEPGIRAVAGAGITDTITAAPSQALIVEVRDQSGALASGVEVRFEPTLMIDPPSFVDSDEPTLRVCSLQELDCRQNAGRLAFDTTDARGRAQVWLRMGPVAGPGAVRMVVPELGFADSATFTITPGAPAYVLPVHVDNALDIGGTATLSGRVMDRRGNRRTETTTLSAGPGSAITLNAATGAVTAREMGTQWVLMRYKALVDSGRVRVLPPGRVLVWSSDERAVLLVNLNGTDKRTILTNISSAFPQFDPTRQRITVHTSSGEPFGAGPNTLIVIDTTGTSRREIGPDIGFSRITATRNLADGTIMVVGTRSMDTSHPGFALWRVATDNTITFVVELPGLRDDDFGGADISHDGTRVAYVSAISSQFALRLLDVVSGSTTVLDTGGNSPRWSAQDDRLVYLGPLQGDPRGGIAMVINANGSGRRALGTSEFTPKMSWSPDGVYVIGRSNEDFGLRLIRVNDGAVVALATGCCHDYRQPDWR